MIESQVRSSSRLAGGVKRYHTWPVLTEQTVAEHTFHILRIYWQIWGPESMTPEAVTQILWHDLGEIETGDVPFQMKRRYPALGETLREAEKLKVQDLADYNIPQPDEQTLLRVKMCDLIEMHEYGLHELALGNQFAQPIVHDTDEAIGAHLERMSPGDQELCEGYLETYCEVWV